MRMGPPSREYRVHNHKVEELEKHKQSRKPWDDNARHKLSVHDDGQDMEAPAAAEEVAGFLGFGGAVLESFVGGLFCTDCRDQDAPKAGPTPRAHP